ncbi:hypothetical protein FSP39_009942 [Pinctada imbricata]|uniref:glutathione transferase n=1 Tax=Pinctada imbricata TaxID=66713 RepID=A0AA89BZB6_PINIB|nr:hypothetical protein FSP39_009942 [Pinctada imbricata]
MSKDKYVLTYFNGRGRAELSRLIFAATKTPFEDKRIGGDDWTKFKPKVPNGQLPVLEVGGKMLPQSMTIARFLSKELGKNLPMTSSRHLHCLISNIKIFSKFFYVLDPSGSFW